MAKHCAPTTVDLTTVFQALADPTRRSIVAALGHGPATVSTLAAPHTIALPSLMKHLSVLERGGVIRSHKAGRVRTCELVPAALTAAEHWMAEQRALWEQRSDRLVDFVERLHRQPPQEESTDVARRPRRLRRVPRP